MYVMNPETSRKDDDSPFRPIVCFHVFVHLDFTVVRLMLNSLVFICTKILKTEIETLFSYCGFSVEKNDA